MLLLVVTIGLLNICLGLGLAMYYDFGPPGLDGIFEALGPMPPAGPSASPLVSVPLGAPYDPSLTSEAAADSSRPPPLESEMGSPLDTLAEEGLLGEVHDLSATAQSSMAGGVESH